MKNRKKTYRFIISGGGTGGHIFPALAIANEIKGRMPDAQILFVGAKGRMEMEKIPAAGYPIEALWISGINRTNKLKNLSFPLKLVSSLWKAGKIINKFKPDAVIGTGGFASGPVLYVAQKKGIPTFIQEQNSYPGITNKLLAKNALKIYTAYDNLDNFFNPEKILLTGNPIRESLKSLNENKTDALNKFGLQPNKKTLLVVGGSLGAMQVNRAIEKYIDEIKNNQWQLIWQTGKNHYEKFRKYEDKSIKVMPFINDMNQAYAAADLIISRAGAGSISELAVVGKPVILIPSPYLAEDHQTKNAKALSDKNAAILIKEKDLDKNLIHDIQKILNDEKYHEDLQKNLKQMAKPNAVEHIVDDIFKQLKI